MRSIDGNCQIRITSDGQKVEEIVISAEYQWMAHLPVLRETKGSVD